MVGWGRSCLRNIEHFQMFSTKATGNKAQLGGALLIANGAGFTGNAGNNLFEENSALYGGPIFFLAAGGS